MPIVFVHGVATRDETTTYNHQLQTIMTYLRQYIAPVIAPDPEQVEIYTAYWGDMGVKFMWHGASCPPSQTSPIRGHPLSTLLPTGSKRDLWRDIQRRGIAIPGHLTARAVAFMRQELNRQSSIFLGDAFAYFARRGTAEHPGPIPLRLLETLVTAHTNQQERGGERLVVFSHSMGGQIVYDVVTSFLPHNPTYADIHIDFWAAASSQIGLFEEMKLFLASDPAYGSGNPVPFPDHRFLTTWWNIWDPHDFLSFSVQDIIAEVDDSFFDSGLSLTSAHFGGLELPSFYSLFASKLQHNVGPDGQRSDDKA